MSEQEKKTAQSTEPGAPGRRPVRRAPLFLEAVYVVSIVALLGVGLGTVGLSLLAGVEIWLAAARGGLAVVVLGGVLWLVNYRLMHGALEAAVQEASEKKAARGDAAATRTSLDMEWKA